MRLNKTLELAKSIIESGRDSKLETLKKILLESFRAEGDLGSGKVIVFTEFVDTADYVYQRLKAWLEDMGYGGSIRILTSRNKEEAKSIQKWLEGEGKRILIATDVASEGLNLQSANILVNYEITWSPIKLEQRIGRIWRYGQRRRAFVFNLFLAHSLEEKVANIVFAKLYNITMAVPKMEQILGEKVLVSTKHNHLFEDTGGSRILIPMSVEFKRGRRNLTDLEIINMIAEDAQGFVEAFLRALRELNNLIRVMKIYPNPLDARSLSHLLLSLTGFADNSNAYHFVRKLIETFAEIEKYGLEENHDSIFLKKSSIYEIKMHNPERALEELNKLIKVQDSPKYYFFNDDEKEGLVLARIEVHLGGEKVYRDVVGIELGGDVLRGPRLAEAIHDILPRSIPVDEIYGFEDILEDVDKKIREGKNKLYYSMVYEGVKEIQDSLRSHDESKGWRFFETPEPEIELRPLVYLLGNKLLPMPGEVPKTTVTGWVEREGEEIVMRIERERGAVPERVSGTEHYDILSKSDGEVRFIEVKTSTLSNRIRIKLTESERDFAVRNSGYWLYLVFGVRSSRPVVLAIKDPINRLLFQEKKIEIIKKIYEVIL